MNCIPETHEYKTSKSNESIKEIIEWGDFKLLDE